MPPNRSLSNFIKRFINFIISYPRLTVLLPTILIFTISYHVTYDYTIREINCRIASYLGSDIVSTDYSNTRLNNLIDLLNRGNPESLTLTTFEFSNKNIQQKQNALTFEVLNEMKNLHVNLTRKYDDIVIISPLSSWYIDWDIEGEAAEERKIEFNNSILRAINSLDYIQMDSLLINNINKVNHLITSCEIVKFYIVHHPNLDIKGPIIEAIHDTTYLGMSSMSSTTDVEGLVTFVYYSHIQNGSSSSTNLYFSLTSAIEIIVLLIFILYILIAIANQHKIRSNGGLLIAWVVEVLIAGGASISILDYFHDYKSRMSEHLTTFTASAYIFTIMVVSSRNLFRIINDLAGDDYVNNSHENIHKKLYKFYLGISNNDKDNNESLKRISGFLNSYRVCRKLLQYFCNIPIISKVLIIDIVLIAQLKIFSLYFFGFSLNSPFKEYLTTRLSYFLEAVCVALVIDHFLQLTYLVGIIIIDLKRYDLTDLLNYQAFQRNESLILPNNSIEGNFLSCILLKLNYPSHLRPSRSSVRYKMGEYLLKVRYSTSLTTWVVMLPLIESVYLLGIFMNWRIMLPYNVIRNPKGIGSMTAITILRDETNWIFYVEYLCILVFIVAISTLTFKLTHSDSLDRKPIKIDESDFVLEDKNIFRCIDLINLRDGHNLDVLKITTNSNTSFIVSIGLDHKILIWSPLNKPILRPIDISATINDTNDREFWPINHINISNDGGYIILINYKNKLIKCFERKKLSYSWQCEMPPISGNRIKVLESFFRKRTVPGFLSRKILQQQKADRKNRRGSATSLSSMNSNMNGNFPFPMNSPKLSVMMQPINENLKNEGQELYETELEKQLNRDDFIMVLETGELITISCNTGELKTFDIFASVYNTSEGKKFNSVKKLTTPRVNDRVICHVNNYDIIVASIINNTWRFRILKVHEGFYNKGIHFALPPPMSASSSLNEINDFSFMYNQRGIDENNKECEIITNSKMQINKATIVTVEFVGMIIRVNNLVAEIIDVQGGIILKRFHVGRFKPLTFKVSHLEPTHCKFCGCVSIQSFSILYEDYDKNTIIVHTFKIDANRSKNNICLRVERDPREIRCVGFSSVSEHLFWYENLECWQLTDINMIIGIKKKCIQQEEDMEILDEDARSSSSNIGTLIKNSGLQSLRSRKLRNPKPKLNEQSWEGFIVTLVDGNLLYYQIPACQTDGLIVNKVTCSEKFGYKSMIVNFGNLIKIIYLGNDKLIENDLYYSGTTSRSLPLPTDNLKVPQLNHDLLFINKRSRHNNLHKL